MMTESQRHMLQMKATSKLLREYFSGVLLESFRCHYDYSEKKIRELASSYKQGKNDIFELLRSEGMLVVRRHTKTEKTPSSTPLDREVGNKKPDFVPGRLKMGTKKPLLFPKSRKTLKNGVSGNKSFIFVPKNAFPGTELPILFPLLLLVERRRCRNKNAVKKSIFATST